MIPGIGTSQDTVNPLEHGVRTGSIGNMTAFHDPPPFDLLVLTASDARQAEIYRHVVGRMVEDGLVAARDLLVVPDPGGRRVGSGGATLEAGFQAARHFAAETGPDDPASLLHGKRVAVVHSGGESRRLPAFAAAGKILMPFPRNDGRPGSGTMLEAIVASLAGATRGARFVVASGDALVMLDGVRLDLPGLVGVAQSASIERGSRHGVYVKASDGSVRDILQKPDEVEARGAGAVRRGRMLLVDTGVLSFDFESIGRWLRVAGVTLNNGRLVVGPGLLAGIRAGRTGPIELYNEMLKAIPAAVDAVTFRRVAGGEPGSDRRRLLSEWRRGVRGMDFRVETDRGRSFLHPGTTPEYLDLVQDPGRAPGRDSGRDSERDGDDERIRSIGRNLVTGISANTRLELRRGECVFALPIRDRRDRGRWLVVAHHERDDFKTPIDAGGTLGGRSLLDRTGSPEQFVEPGGTLREARLWSIGSVGSSLAHALRTLREGPRATRGTRWSLVEALGRLDVPRLLAHRDRWEQARLESEGADLIRRRPDVPVGAIADRLDGSGARSVASELRRSSDVASDHLEGARLAAAASRFAERGGDGRRDDDLSRALARVGDLIAAPIEPASDDRPATVLPDQAVWCTAPVRIDLAGGWSDTPPMCVDQGGTVVNAAVLLHGKPPIQAFSKRLDEPKIVVHSVDLGSSRVFTNTRQLHAPGDPADWTTLPRMALRLAGVTPSDPRSSLRRRLERLGGGVVLTLHSAVPKGSGMGTSSILGATVLACLERLFGDGIDGASIIERTSALEQMMTTRGGWQDQVGGIHGGLKIARTLPGPSQRPVVESLAAPSEFLQAIEARAILLYSGEQRLARDILEKVVGRYLTRERGAVRIIGRLKDGAEAMASAIRTGDIDEFTRRLAEYWRLKRAFDPAATNPRIDAIAAGHARDLAAWELPGAGGGGFVLMLARDESAAARIRRRADRRPANPLSRRFPLEIDPVGLTVTVL